MTTFRFPPRATRGAMLGFSTGQLGCVFAGAVCGIMALNLATAGRPLPALGVFVAGLGLGVLGLARLRGRRITAWVPIVAGALLQRVMGQHRYRGAAFAPRREELDLPGPAAGYRWLTATTADGVTEVGLLVHRVEGTVTAALRCYGAGFTLADTGEQQQRLAAWSDVINVLGGEYAQAGLVRWALLTRTVPDSDDTALRYLAGHATDTGSAAYRSLAALTAAAAPAAQRHEIYLTVVLDRRRLAAEVKDSGGTDTALAVVVLERLAGIEAAVREADIGTGGWLSPRVYAGVLRSQFDPDMLAHTITDDGTPAGAAPQAAGPAATEQVGWSYLRHDSGLSQTLWIYEMPRQPVPMSWLTGLFARTVGRVAVTLVAEPVPPQLAALATRRDKVAAAGERATKARLQLVRTAREDAEEAAVHQIDAEQAAGHVRYRYALLVTVTAATLEQLQRHARVARQILSRAGCECIVLYGEQDQAFAAGALPLARGLKPRSGVWA
ncbi:SCO6880 family protein [Catenuloplanes japonicus]|uniref:SCO6880 family protein n=1 Tax=Catenuloplanes japonicus TaxID=33876 RepID=UPI0005246A16